MSSRTARTTNRSSPMHAVRSTAATLDQLVNLSKWPVAAASVLLLPNIAAAVWQVVRDFTEKPWWLCWFVGGFVAFFPLWKALRRLPKLQRWAMTVEHELTHALFALLTLHPVSNLRASWRGGSVTFGGGGNWLITLAPYCFATTAFLLMPLGLLMPWLLWPIWQALLGAALAYHLTSTAHQLHARQTDLKQAGWLFSALFLPAANLASLGSVLGFASHGLSGMFGFWRDMLCWW